MDNRPDVVEPHRRKEDDQSSLRNYFQKNVIRITELLLVIGFVGGTMHLTLAQQGKVLDSHAVINIQQTAALTQMSVAVGKITTRVEDSESDITHTSSSANKRIDDLDLRLREAVKRLHVRVDNADARIDKLKEGR